MSFRDAFHTVNPYLGFKPKPAKPFTAWGSEDPNFAVMIERYRPQAIIEVGSWLGGSALHMASLCDAEMLCVDPWTGSGEMWMNLDDETRHGALELKNGFPQFYLRFLSNIIHAGKQDQITPLPLPSLAAAQAVKYHKLTADLIYIDAGHSTEEVYADLCAWWDVATKAVFGDDFYTWMTVGLAVTRFAEERKIKLIMTERQWILEK